MQSGLLLAWQLARSQIPDPPLPADEVQWTAPQSCPDREALLAGIAHRRGRALTPGQVRVVAHITARYRLDLQLELGGRHEARVLTASSCAALVDAAALLIALAVDAEPDVAPEPPPLEPAAPPSLTTTTPLAPEELTPAPAPPLAPLAAPRRRPGGFLRLHALGELGALPGPTGGVGLAGGLLWPRFRLELRASYLAPRTVTRPQADVRAFLFAGALLGCARLGRGALELPLCGGLELGGMPGAADGPDVRATPLGRWFAVVASVGATWRVHPRVGLSAALEGLAAVQRSTLVLRDPGPELVLFDPGVLSARLALGVELRFGAAW